MWEDSTSCLVALLLRLLCSDVLFPRWSKFLHLGLGSLEVGWFNPATGEQLKHLPESVQTPLRILWRSILLPSVTVLQ